MDKGAIKKFAVTARNKLMEAVAQKAFELGITEGAVKEAEVYQDGFLINQKFYKKYEIKQREKLIHEIEQKGYEQVIDEVAYTWFNRFIALRFMEVNDYLPTGVRIFSSIEPGKTEPDAMTEVLMLVDDLDLDEQKVYELQDANDDEDLFKYILIKQCNKLGEMMPIMFEEIEDYTELLLPNQLLAETSVIHDMVTLIEEDDWTQEVEIIGWLYQYYISEKKDEVFAALKKNKKITKENIPAATELFTPRWIVQYMVDNALGRLWLESHPDNALQEKLPYYLEAAEQPEYVVEQLERLKDRDLKPESIQFIDPCMGSGHILVYAFEVFYQLYQSQGYRGQDIPKLILENNLYGLDIDPRAAQLAYFSVMMKARSYNSRIFASPINTNLHWIEESNVITEQDVDIFVGDTDLSEDFELLIDTFKDGRLYGSIIEVPEIDFTGLKERANVLKEAKTDDMFAIDFNDHVLPVVERLIDQAVILARKYDVVVTNPPYMGSSGMNEILQAYVNESYPFTKRDLSTVFMEQCSTFTTLDGYYALINIPTWMNLSSYEEYRKKLLCRETIIDLLHLGRGVFGSDFGTVSVVFRKTYIKNYTGFYQKLFVKKSSVENNENKRKLFFNGFNVYKNNQENYYAIQGCPIAYNATESIIDIYKNEKKLSETSELKVGLQTGSNDRFLRFWHELHLNKIGFKLENREVANHSKLKWFPYNKGGEYRKYYGNNYYVVNWKNDGYEIRNFKSEKGKLKSRPQNMDYYFKESVSWSKVTIGGFSTRIIPKGFIFDVAGCSIFAEKEQLLYILGLTNSKIAMRILDFLSPTVNYEVGHISNIPIKMSNTINVNNLVNDNIETAKSDWDSFETSWDFKTHPFLEFQQGATKLSDAFINWQQVAENRFQTLKANEEELNRIFIDLYGLQDELTPEVEDKDVTVNRADQVRDVKSFLSYSVGLMLGRYSLHKEGLAFAGGDFDLDKYQSFQPDADNVIPIADDVYFEDDIVTRLITIMKTIYGQDNLEENLDFIADTLTRKANETSRQRIRRYFLKEFYKDHVQTYQKRPIYWLFDSGKQDGFKALVYMHRYQPGLVARVRTGYLHAQQRKYEEEMDRLDMMLESDISKQEQTKVKKQKEKLQKQVLECQNYDQLIAHVANQKLELDLDDGVKGNYAKFQNIEIPQGEGKKPIKGNLLTKI
ncbi:BREX-1 system adenine-specific DNA-methyltransferase PglX [Virgibacillus dakarensis]|uniref:BREX-1 system adenine-specific DNA-methyltransferase PglX n=1 Tax=Virgibacillus dakarensis TaxID=1917889 RepID=UPI000B43E396|nr:BREX-1 system adenine-specific DNA-methyltransferase PglX [Virgibacillus dakarensis]